MDSLFEENISNFRFITLDTETTGTNQKSDCIVEIAALCFDEEFEQRRFETLITPSFPIPSEVTAIHGITDEMVQGSPSPGEAFAQFFHFLKWCGTPRILLAHNASFDVGMILGQFQRQNLQHSALSNDAVPEMVLDTCRLAKSLLPELKSHGVAALAEHFKVSEFRHHRAMEDVKALREIFLNLLAIASDKCAVGTALSLGKIVDLCGGYFLLDHEVSQSKSYQLSPTLRKLSECCDTQAHVGIVYGVEEEFRYITPQNIRNRGLHTYIDALCHRDGTQKSFRADRILRILITTFLLAFSLSLSVFAKEKPILDCNGKYKGNTCEVGIWMNGCKNSILLSWRPLLNPGTEKWANTHRNYCSVQWNGQNVLDERKFPPERCDEIFKTLEEGLQEFPDLLGNESVKKEEPKKKKTVKELDLCEKIRTGEGEPLSLLSEISPTDALLGLKNPLRVVKIEEMGYCKLYDRKKESTARSSVPIYSYRSKERRFVHCPVLPETVHRWWRKLLSLISADCIIQNEVR